VSELSTCSGTARQAVWAHAMSQVQWRYATHGRQSILALYDQQMRRDPPPAGADCDSTARPYPLYESSSEAQGGWILYTQLDDQNVRSGYSGADRRFFCRGGARLRVKTYDHDRPSRRGPAVGPRFTPEEPEALLVLESGKRRRPACSSRPRLIFVRLAAGDTLADLALVQQRQSGRANRRDGPRFGRRIGGTPTKGEFVYRLCRRPAGQRGRIAISSRPQFAPVVRRAPRVPAPRGRGLYTASVACPPRPGGAGPRVRLPYRGRPQPPMRPGRFWSGWGFNTYDDPARNSGQGTGASMSSTLTRTWRLSPGASTAHGLFL